ncbi:MAG: hypothetical protein WBG02_11735 [Candidatus Acidiferrum sp.]
MNHQNDRDLRELLKRIMPPANTELPRDLWPSMLERLGRQPVRVPWFDWLLAACAGAIMIFFPGIIPALFYHL